MIDPQKLKALTRAIERLERAFAAAMNAPENRLGEGDGPQFCSADQPSVGARAKTGTVSATADVPLGGFAEVRTVRDKAELARRRAQADSLGLEVENRAAELKLWAERRLGQKLECLVPYGGDRRSKNRASARLTLAQLGVTHDQSRRWRRVFSVSDVEFNKYLAGAKRRGERITTADVLRLAEMSGAAIVAPARIN